MNDRLEITVLHNIIGFAASDFPNATAPLELKLGFARNISVVCFEFLLSALPAGLDYDAKISIV